MEEEFGASYISITDDEGNEFELEHLGMTEYEGEEYVLFLPADMDENDPDYGYIILKIEVVDNEEQFVTVDDEDVLQAVYERFMEEIFADEDEE